MNDPKLLFFTIVIAWVGWLLLNGWRTQEVWAKGGSEDRFTRSLDMHSFAHKVHRHEHPYHYWLYMLLYLTAELYFIYAYFKL